MLTNTHLDSLSALTQFPVPEDVLDVVDKVLPLGGRSEVVDLEDILGRLDDLVIVLIVHVAAHVGHFASLLQEHSLLKLTLPEISS